MAHTAIQENDWKSLMYCWKEFLSMHERYMARGTELYHNPVGSFLKFGTLMVALLGVGVVAIAVRKKDSTNIE